jgi:hypothetical protein
MSITPPPIDPLIGALLNDWDGTATLEQRQLLAEHDCKDAHNKLMDACDLIAMPRSHADANPHGQLAAAIEVYARAAARAEMIKILSSEDFFLAMANSASKVG